MLEAHERQLTFREITISDATAAAELSGELGYPVSPEVMAQRIEELQRSANHTVYVACLSQQLVGWIDVGICHHLQSEPYAEVGGLVVADGLRSTGIGRHLLAQAEQWAKARILAKMLVRSRVAREAAHRFYLREGYEHTKTSAVFTKHLS